MIINIQVFKYMHLVEYFLARRRLQVDLGLITFEKRENWSFGTILKRIRKIFLKFSIVSHLRFLGLIITLFSLQLYFVLKIAPKKYKDLLLPWRPTRQIICVKIGSYERSILQYYTNTYTHTHLTYNSLQPIFFFFFFGISSLFFFL